MNFKSSRVEFFHVAGVRKNQGPGAYNMYILLHNFNLVCTAMYPVLAILSGYCLFYIERTCIKRTCNKWKWLVCTDRLTIITRMLSDIPRFYLQHDVSRVDPWCEPLGSTLSITKCQRLILSNESPRWHGSKLFYKTQCTWAPLEE